MQKQLLLCLSITWFVFISSCKNGTKEPTIETTKSDWKTIELGSMGFSAEAPFNFIEQNMEGTLTPAVREKIKKMETFTNEEKGNYYAINIAEYAYDVNFSSTAAINGAVTEMRMRAGGEVSNRKDEAKQINGNEAATVQATFTDSKKDKRELQMAILNKGNIMYQVICLYKDGNEDKRKEATRIIESIRIK